MRKYATNAESVTLTHKPLQHYAADSLESGAELEVIRLDKAA